MSLVADISAAWTGFFTAVDTTGGHLMLLIALYAGMKMGHCQEGDCQMVLGALLATLRPNSNP